MVYLTGDTHGSYRHAHTRPASFVPQALHAGVKARWTLRWKTGSKSSRNAWTIAAGFAAASTSRNRWPICASSTTTSWNSSHASSTCLSDFI